MPDCRQGSEQASQDIYGIETGKHSTIGIIVSYMLSYSGNWRGYGSNYHVAGT